MKVVSLLISVIQNYKEKRKEKKEERKWKESLENKIIIDLENYFTAFEFKIKKFNTKYIQFQKRFYLPVGLSFESVETLTVKILSKETQEEIKNYFRYKKLKNII